MGILAALRRTVADAFQSAFAEEPARELVPRVSRDGVWPITHQATLHGLCLTVQQDYQGAPWSWTAEDVASSKLVAFRGSAGETYDVAALSLSQWLDGPDGRACQAPSVDGPPRAA